MDFIESIKTNLKNKNVSDSTIKNYIRNLEILNDDKEIKNFNYLKSKDKIIKKLEDKKPNTRRNYLISIVSVLDKDKDKKLREFYYNLMMDINKSAKEEASQNIKSETQEKNWIEWSEVENKLNALKEEVEGYKKNINETEYYNVLKFMVLSLYTLTAPRRNKDYMMMNITKDKEFNDDMNYLLYDKQKFIFKVYKTSKTELKDNESKEIDIPDNLYENINLYLKFHPLIKNKKLTAKSNIPFLVNFNGERLKQVNTITYILNSIFKPKKISSSMLRHLYLSNKYGNVLEEMKEDSQKMSHNLTMQQEYIKK